MTGPKVGGMDDANGSAGWIVDRWSVDRLRSEWGGDVTVVVSTSDGKVIAAYNPEHIASRPLVAARAERYRLAWLSARRRAGEAVDEADVWRRLAKGGPVNEEDEQA